MLATKSKGWLIGVGKSNIYGMILFNPKKGCLDEKDKNYKKKNFCL